MELHYISVRTSKENYEKVYRFKIIPADDK
jgi:hypothetical protein